MLNEEVSKEVLGQAARTVENEVVKPINYPSTLPRTGGTACHA